MKDQLETIPEIIAKKIFYRGSSIMPRDIFDIAAAGKENADTIIRELRSYKAQVAQTLASMSKLNPEFVNSSIADLAIKGHYKALAKTALSESKAILQAV